MENNRYVIGYDKSTYRKTIPCMLMDEVQKIAGAAPNSNFFCATNNLFEWISLLYMWFWNPPTIYENVIFYKMFLFLIFFSTTLLIFGIKYGGQSTGFLKNLGLKQPTVGLLWPKKLGVIWGSVYSFFSRFFSNMI